MDKEITFQYQPTLKNHMRLTYTSVTNSLGYQVIFGMLMLLPVYSVLDKEDPLGKIVFSALLLILIPVRLYFYSKKQFETNPYFKLQRDWKINSTSISITTNMVTVQRTWASVTKIVATKHFLLFYVIEGHFYAIDKSCLTSADQDTIMHWYNTREKPYVS